MATGNNLVDNVMANAQRVMANGQIAQPNTQGLTSTSQLINPNTVLAPSTTVTPVTNQVVSGVPVSTTVPTTSTSHNAISSRSNLPILAQLQAYSQVNSGVPPLNALQNAVRDHNHAAKVENKYPRHRD